MTKRATDSLRPTTDPRIFSFITRPSREKASRASPRINPLSSKSSSPKRALAQRTSANFDPPLTYSTQNSPHSQQADSISDGGLHGSCFPSGRSGERHGVRIFRNGLGPCLGAKKPQDFGAS